MGFPYIYPFGVATIGSARALKRDFKGSRRDAAVLIGQTVLAGWKDAILYYSPWMPRQGNDMTAVTEVIKTSGVLTLTCAVETKNAEDADSAASNLGSVDATTAGTVTKSVIGCKELVRYRFEATGTSQVEWVHFRSNSPIWQPN